ncbi:MAG: FHA domain-containing protein [Proteobacteria bacterium]|nr:MAG: FHA domain-containing protein [Pseudomonadota bacterium]
MPFFLKILAAPEGEPVGIKLPLVDGQNLVGRISPPCSIVLKGTKVSKKHGSFLVQGNSVTVEDLKSSNGTFVNGKQVAQATLKLKDRLVVGEYTLELGEA